MPNLFPVISLLALFALSPAHEALAMAPDPAENQDDGQVYLDQYLTATKKQEEKLRHMSMAMDMEIEASLPSLNRKGKFHALRQISKLGKITYRAITFQGDNTIKNDVIARYLQAEKESAEKNLNLARTTENYKFKYYGEYKGEGDWHLYLFELTPKQKKPGFFNGWLWIEAKSGLPVREQGEFVKNPSIFLKSVEFIRDYEIRDGVAVPIKVDSQIQTRVAGKAELSIRYSNVATDQDESANPSAASR